MNGNMDIKDLKELYLLKKKDPEEYKEFLKSIKDIAKDMMTVVKEVMEEIE